MPLFTLAPGIINTSTQFKAPHQPIYFLSCFAPRHIFNSSQINPRKMPGREIKKTLGSLFHGIISPSPYSENSSRRLRDFQEAVSSTRQSTSQKETDNNTNQSQDREITDALAAHNHARRSAPTACEVQRADLKWSRELTASAQRWANYLADHGKFKHGILPFPVPLSLMIIAEDGCRQENARRRESLPCAK